MEPLDCVINPSVVADLGSGVPGILRKVRVDRSDFVNAGDVIAELESGVEIAALELSRARAELTAEVDLRQVNAAFGQRQNKRTRDLFQRKAISTNDMDQRQTEARLAQLQLRQANDNKALAQLEMQRAQEILKRRTIKSPINGVVMDRFKVIGEYVEDKPVVRVAQIDPLHVEVIVPVEKLGMVHNGMQAKVWSETMEGTSWQATVSRVDQVADVASGTYGVRLTMPNPDHKIPAGLRCRMQLVEAPPAPVEETNVKAMETASEAVVTAAMSEATEKPVVAEKPAVQKPATATARAKVQPARVIPIQRKANSDAEPAKEKAYVAEVSAPATTPKVVEAAAVQKAAKPVPTPVEPIQHVVSSDAAKAEDKTEFAQPSEPAPKVVNEPVAPAPAPVAAAVEKKEKVAKEEIPPAAVVEEKKATIDVEAVSALPECRLAGPYSDEVKATKKVVTLRRAGLYVDIKSVPSTTSSSFMIATPVLPNRDEAKALVARLKAAGFTDYYVPRKRSTPLRVSLGIYNSKRIAERKIKELAKKGFTTELLPWKQKGSQYFLVIRGTRSEANGKLLASLPVPDGKAESTQGFCNHLAGR